MIHHGNCIEWLATLADKSVDHCCTDPPYDEHVHGKQRRLRTKVDATRRYRGVSNAFHGVRQTKLGFDAITSEEMGAVMFHIARVVRRWTLVFSSAEMTHRWREAAIRYGLEHIRIVPWIKLCSTPQLTGDRPAQAWEAINVFHPRGRKRWNSGGKRGVYTYSIEVNRGGKSPRHEDDTTPKPIPLLLEILDDYTEPRDLVIDPFSGMGSMGEACIIRGRNFLGCELQKRKATRANERLIAVQEGSNIRAREAGQLPLLGGTR